MASVASHKNCEICLKSLRSKSGSFVSTVPLLCETNNKEICSALGGKPVVLAELLLTMGIPFFTD